WVNKLFPKWGIAMASQDVAVRKRPFLSNHRRSTRRSRMLRILLLILFATGMYARKCEMIPVKNASPEGTNAAEIATKLNKFTEKTAGDRRPYADHLQISI